MTDSAAILEIRHVRLTDSATLQPATLPEGEGVFVAMEEPPPVRTVLAVIEGDARRALEVTRVVEMAERDERGRRGIYARWVDDDALARAMKVGTEHLEDGMPEVQPVSHDDTGSAGLSDTTSMAMPAPVMIAVDDTGVIDVDDREDADDESSDGAYDGSGESSDGAYDESGESSDGADESSDGADESSESSESSDDESGEGNDESGEASTDESADQSDGRKSRGGRRKRGRRKR